jgi:hypothetical protein
MRFRVPSHEEVVNVQRHRPVDYDSPTAVEGKCLAEATGARKWNLSADGAEDVEVHLAAGLPTTANDSPTQVGTMYWSNRSDRKTGRDATEEAAEHRQANLAAPQPRNGGLLPSRLSGSRFEGSPELRRLRLIIHPVFRMVQY